MAIRPVLKSPPMMHPPQCLSSAKHPLTQCLHLQPILQPTPFSPLARTACSPNGFVIMSVGVSSITIIQSNAAIPSPKCLSQCALNECRESVILQPLPSLYSPFSPQGACVHHELQMQRRPCQSSIDISGKDSRECDCFICVRSSREIKKYTRQKFFSSQRRPPAWSGELP